MSRARTGTCKRGTRSQATGDFLEIKQDARYLGVDALILDINDVHLLTDTLHSSLCNAKKAGKGDVSTGQSPPDKHVVHLTCTSIDRLIVWQSSFLSHASFWLLLTPDHSSHLCAECGHVRPDKAMRVAGNRLRVHVFVQLHIASVDAEDLQTSASTHMQDHGEGEV